MYVGIVQCKISRKSGILPDHIYVNKNVIFDLIRMSSKKSTRFYQENKTKYNKMYKKVHAQQK